MSSSKFSRRLFVITAGLATTTPFMTFGKTTERQIEGGLGGTGIVGLLTGLGSLYINGNYLLTDQGTMFSDAFGRLRESDLSEGMSLTVEAGQDRDTNLIARRVHVTYPLVGAISSIKNSRRTLVVNGIEVSLPSALRRFKLGDHVAVSGLWRGDRVIGSKVQSARSAQDLVAGVASRSSSRMTIGSVRFRGTTALALRDGSFATAIGKFDPKTGEIKDPTIIKDRFTGAAGPLTTLSIEGYLEPIKRRPGYRISGLGHSFAQNLALGRYAGTRVLFTGPYDGKFATDRATVLPEAKTQRRQILQRLLDTK